MNLIPYPKEIVFEEKQCLNPDNVIYQEDFTLMNEEYLIKIKEELIEINYKTTQGLLYAKQTLLQLKAEDIIPCCIIRDYPIMEYRGAHIDVCRYFMSVNEVKSYIDFIAMFKFNILHFHLNDEQGWRIEIDAYPDLCKIGSKRTHSDYGRGYDPQPHEGYYTKEEIKDIVQYAKEKGIEVMPEIEIPGHCSSILAAYPELSCTGKLVHVKTRGGVYKEILCAGKDEVYVFIKQVLDEVCELFPYSYFHLGGDEAQKDEWRQCPNCQKKMRDKGIQTISQLQDYMILEITDYLKTKNKQVIIFSDGLREGNLYHDIDFQYWVGDTSLVQQKIDAGSEVIVSTHGAYYLDLPYSQTSLRKVYDYNPYEHFTRIKGIEGMLWREFIPDFNRCLYMAFPRLLAVSETAWNGNQKQSYDDFIKRVEKLLKNHPEIKASPKNVWDMPKSKKIIKTIQFYYQTMTKQDRKQFIETLKNERKEKKENESITTNNEKGKTII